MHKLYLLLGSNMGNSEALLETACRHVSEAIGDIRRRSSIYVTAAWGLADQPDFLNQVLAVQTRKEPVELMKTILSIEEKMGRIRTVKNAPRIIDIDILFYDQLVLESRLLTIPHPRIPERRFVLIPMNELAPAFRHPGLGRTMHELLEACPDPLGVKKL